MGVAVSRTILLVMLLGIPSVAVFAQRDSTYIGSYRGYVMPRLHFGRKTTGMNYHNEQRGYTLRYQPNKTFNLGLGLTYKFATVRVSVGLLQPHQQRGNTRDLDIQLHKYGKRFVTDALIQFYKGFYLPDQRFGATPGEYYVRPDLAVSAVGASVQYVSNHRRFSYRAAFQQTEWQKKSAGTLLLGVEMFVGRFRADSTIVPAQLQHENWDGLRKMRFVEIGPNAGAAYTWVYKRFFMTAGASLSLNAGISRYYGRNGGTTFAGVSPNTVIRLSSGYNVRQWGFNVMYISTGLRLPEFNETTLVLNTGTVRVNFVYRLLPDKRVKKWLRPIDSVEERLQQL